MTNLKEKLDDVERVIMDVRMASDFLEQVSNNKGVVNLVSFGSGEAIFTKISDAEITQINKRITALISQLKSKVLDINQEQ